MLCFSKCSSSSAARCRSMGRLTESRTELLSELRGPSYEAFISVRSGKHRAWRLVRRMRMLPTTCVACASKACCWSGRTQRPSWPRNGRSSISGRSSAESRPCAVFAHSASGSLTTRTPAAAASAVPRSFWKPSGVPSTPPISKRSSAAFAIWKQASAMTIKLMWRSNRRWTGAGAFASSRCS